MSSHLLRQPGGLTRIPGHPIRNRRKAAATLRDLTDNEDLKREGKIDEAGGKTKDKADELVDKVADLLKNKNN